LKIFEFLMKDKKKVFLIIRFVLITYFVLMNVYLFFVKKHMCLDTEVYENTNPTPNIFKKNTVGQTFTADNNDLCRIEVRFGTHGRKNDKKVRFQLWELTPDRKLAAELSFNAAEVKNNLFHSFDFKTLKESKDKKYYFKISSPQSAPQNSICAWMNKGNIYLSGEYFLKGSKKDGDLVFRVYSKRPVIAKLDRIVRNYPGIFGKRWFLIVVIVFFEAMMLLVLLIIIKAGKGYV